MATIKVKTEPTTWDRSDTVCRLCMSEESLGDVFREEGLLQWIWDYLSIVVSEEDRLSRVICTICRIQLTEFHRFRIRCQDVQCSLQSMAEEEDRLKYLVSITIKTEPGTTGSLQRMCRLCMSEESLSSVFKQEGLHELVLDYLSIVVSCEDRLSQTICAICRLQLTEFNQFRSRCQDVQSILQSTVLAGSSGVQKVEAIRNSTLNCEAAYGLESVGTGNAPRYTRIETSVATSSSGFSKQQMEDRAVDAKNHQRTGELITNDEQIVNEPINIKTEPFEEVNFCTDSQEHKAELQPAMVYIPSDIVHKQERSSPAENHELVGIRRPNAAENPVVVEEVNVEPPRKKPPYKPKEQISPCSFCDRVCMTRNKLRRHIQIVHGPRPHECRICNYQAALHRDLRKHLQTKQHFKKVHESLGDEAFAVPAQSKKASDNEQSTNEPEIRVKTEKEQPNSNEDEETLLEEMKTEYLGSDGNEPSTQTTEEQQLQCDVCHKMFPMDREKLLNHKWYAHGFNKFECPICGRPFLLQFRMQLHMRTHEGPKNRGKLKDQDDLAKPFKCEVCEEEFRLKKTYNYHRRQKHGLTENVCNICEKPFAYPYQLKEHMEQNDHSRIVKRGPKKSRLQDMNDNGNGKSYKCRACQKVFNQQSSLYTHQKMKHEEKPHACTICNKAFAYQCQLKVHMQKHENPSPRKRRETKLPAGDGPLTRAKHCETKPPNYCEDSDD